MRAPRVLLENLGCRVNRAELDAMGRGLVAAGCELVCAAPADVVVVNTCAVTGEAQAKARHAVRQASEVAGSGVVATGCAASLFGTELAAMGPGVVVEPDKARVCERVLELVRDDREAEPMRPGADASVVDIVDGRQKSGSVTPTGRMRPGLKIQDGCDRRCAYCIVWKARGPARSMGVDDVLSSVRELMADGAAEVVLTGIDLGRYEADGTSLARLVDRILCETSVGRVRLSSVEPAGVTEELLGVMADSRGRVAPFLHVPLQSGCDSTLSRMRRPYEMAQYERTLDRARELVPSVSISTDVIVGFPGETNAEFSESLATCERLAFSGLHVFRYSRRPGTPAATMPCQVAEATKAARSRAMRKLSDRLELGYARSLVGTAQLVLCEHGGMGTTGGGVRVRVDEGLLGRLVTLVPRDVDLAGVLDARGCRII